MPNDDNYGPGSFCNLNHVLQGDQLGFHSVDKDGEIPATHPILAQQQYESHCLPYGGQGMQ